MIFKQLNEKMRAMDRSLLEKVAADIEMLDDDQGIIENKLIVSWQSQLKLYIKAHLRIFSS